MAKAILWLGTITLVALLIVKVPAQAQQGERVAFHVEVTDTKGRDVNGLQLKDFQIFEDGIAQTIGAFTEIGDGHYKISYISAGNTNEGFRRIKIETSGSKYRLRHTPGYRPSR